MNHCLISMTKSISCYLCLLYTNKLYIMSPLSQFRWSLPLFLQSGQHSFISSLNSSWGQCFRQWAFWIWQPFRHRLEILIEWHCSRSCKHVHTVKIIESHECKLTSIIDRGNYFRRKDWAKILFLQKKSSSKYPKIKTFRKLPTIWYSQHLNIVKTVLYWFHLCRNTNLSMLYSYHVVWIWTTRYRQVCLCI